MLKSRVVAGAVLIAAAGLCSISYGQTFVGAHGQLHVQGGHFCDVCGNPIALHGMSMYGWTNTCGYAFYNASCINHLAQDWKCTVIRVPYQTDNSVPMSSLSAVIDACIANGIYCIVDYHSMSDNESAANASAFFRTIATSYHTYPNIMYEPWNEPNGNGGPSWTTVIKPYMETVIGAIRAIDTGNIIICGNPQWDQLPQNAAASPITDYKNIAYSMHFYAHTHSVATFGPGITTAMNAGCAIFITEYGTCDASGGGPVDTAPTRLWYNFLNTNKIGSASWGVECQDQGGAACFLQSASTTGPWADNVFTLDGLFVRAYIQSQYQGLTPCLTGVLSNGSKLQQHVSAPTLKGVLTGTDTKSAVYTINGVRCPAGSKLRNGVYIVRDPGNSKSQCFTLIR